MLFDLVLWLFFIDGRGEWISVLMYEDYGFGKFFCVWWKLGLGYFVVWGLCLWKGNMYKIGGFLEFLEIIERGGRV